jgi:hypothetical protein
MVVRVPVMEVGGAVVGGGVPGREYDSVVVVVEVEGLEEVDEAGEAVDSSVGEVDFGGGRGTGGETERGGEITRDLGLEEEEEDFWGDVGGDFLRVGGEVGGEETAEDMRGEEKRSGGIVYDVSARGEVVRGGGADFVFPRARPWSWGESRVRMGEFELLLSFEPGLELVRWRLGENATSTRLRSMRE